MNDMTIKVKTNDLEGFALNWAVALCENLIESDAPLIFFEGDYCGSWDLAGEIIEREGLGIARDDQGVWFASYDLSAECAWGATGETPIIAAMRCYVASKLGGEVEVPDEI